MKKFLAITLALAAAGTVLTVSNLIGSSLAQTAPVTIQYGTWDGTRRPIDEKLIKAFEVANPNIKVKYNLVPWDSYWEKAAAMTAGGVTFDVMWMNLDNFPFYLSQGALEPITLTQTERKLIPTPMIAPYIAGENTYGLPLGPQAVSVFINRALFKERGVPIPVKGWTMDEVLTAAKKLTFKKGGKQIWGINGNDLQADTEYGMSFYYTRGGTQIIKKTDAGYISSLDPTFKASAQWLYDLVYKHKVSPSPKNITQQSYQMFQAGQMAIDIEGTWMTSVWGEAKKLDWAYAPFPTMKKGDSPKPVYSAHSLVIPKSAKEKEAAMVFAKWATTAVPAQRLLAQNALFPTAADTYKSQYLQALPGKNAETIFNQLPNSVIINSEFHSLSNLPEVLTALYENLNLAWTGTGTLEKALTKASADMDKLLKKTKILELK
jgi:multiple sugar transport system substrate-binding protein